VAESVKVTVAELVKVGRVSKSSVYRAIKARKLTFKGGRADPVKLAAEWQKKRDPSQDDKVGPAIERVIGALGITGPVDPLHGAEQPEGERGSEPTASETYWTVRTRHEKLKAEMTELDVRKRQGELIEAADAKRFWGALIVAIKGRLRAVGATLAPELATEQNPSTIQARIQSEIDEALVHLSTGNWIPNDL
jgi:hypothetical protein